MELFDQHHQHRSIRESDRTLPLQARGNKSIDYAMLAVGGLRRLRFTAGVAVRADIALLRSGRVRG